MTGGKSSKSKRVSRSLVKRLAEQAKGVATVDETKSGKLIPDNSGDDEKDQPQEED